MNKIYEVRRRETGDWISRHTTLNEAKVALENYEMEDRKEGFHDDDYYEIKEVTA